MRTYKKHAFRNLLLLASCILSTISIHAVSAEVSTADSAANIENTLAKYVETDNLSQEMLALREKLMDITDRPDELWSVYLKNLTNGEVICTGTTQMYAASLSKLFVLDYWGSIIDEYPELLDDENFSNFGPLRYLLTDMIEISDNNAFNELVLLIDPKSYTTSFHTLERYLMNEGYAQTGIFHTLLPSEIDFYSISDQMNYTTVYDCGKLLEKIYQGYQAENEVSIFMIDILKNQENDTKIAGGLPESIEIANKTGETDEVEHDVAIVFGPDTDYILCIMNSGYTDDGDAMQTIRDISSLVFFTLNPSAEGMEVNQDYYSDEYSDDFE